jgi:hypothetical protein
VATEATVDDDLLLVVGLRKFKEKGFRRQVIDIGQA